MIVKYYGSSIPNTKTYNVFRHISGYNVEFCKFLGPALVMALDVSYHRNNPSYCVWIVPGTVDMDGNDTGID